MLFFYFNLMHLLNIIDRSRLLVVPQSLQLPPFSKSSGYHTRRSGSILGKLQGFMNLPMDVAFEVSIHTYLPSLQKKLNVANTFFLPSRQPCISIQTISCNFPDSRNNLGLCLRLVLLSSFGELFFATPI
jgi:hypothetical protein